MLRSNFLSQFKNTPYFSKQVLLNLAERFQINHHTLNSYIKLGLKNRELISLKRELYVTADFFDTYKGNQSYIYMLANKFIEPSYISRESALQYYGLLVEVNSSVITSVTKKTTRIFSNNLGNFEYKSIRDSDFSGFKLVTIDRYDYFIAEPYKAIFDYLYFRLSVTELRNTNKLEEYLNYFRIDYDEVNLKTRRKLNKLLKSV